MQEERAGPGAIRGPALFLAGVPSMLSGVRPRPLGGGVAAIERGGEPGAGSVAGAAPSQEGARGIVPMGRALIR